MSMIGNFLQVSQRHLEEYLQDSSLLEKRIYAEGSSDDPDHLDIEKSWEGIFYVLTGKSLEGMDEAQPPLSWILANEKVIDEEQDLGYGPACYLYPDEVKQVYEELRKISDDEFRKRFNPAEMMELGVYPEIWDEGEEALDDLLHYFNEIKSFYEKAVGKGNAIINFIN